MKFALSAIAIVAVSLSASGCASSAIGARKVTWAKPKDDVSYKTISRDLTPELQGSVERRIDADRNEAVTANLQWRLLSDDLGRLFYTDHPTRLSPLPVTGTSGMPR